MLVRMRFGNGELQTASKGLSMGKITLTGKQSDFLKIVAAAAGRGDLEGGASLGRGRPSLGAYRRLSRAHDAVGSILLGQTSGCGVSGRTVAPT